MLCGGMDSARSAPLQATVSACNINNGMVKARLTPPNNTHTTQHTKQVGGKRPEGSPANIKSNVMALLTLFNNTHAVHYTHHTHTTHGTGRRQAPRRVPCQHQQRRGEGL